MKQRLRIRFKNRQELRQGSLWNRCDLQMSGEWIPALSLGNWQDLKAVSPDQRYVALVQWNTKENQPGFHVVRIDTHARTYHKTKRIAGLCRELKWQQDRFVWEKS
ncbi:hypothetical protein [Gimesia fumaroli]|nr:hypothetical protein [Gimesia fumaroli]